MQSLIEIKQRLESAKPLIQQKYHVAQIGIFGSYVRGDQTQNSDVDVLVEFEPGFRFGLLTFCELENYLSDLLGLKVDLVMKKGLKPHIGAQILREVVYL
ncbi:nucleotidyltransferase family protein [Oscillatoria sp. FACHB-1407]|uniref:nucleotidyltransferase family protein n=1 Tax=Oscillatoria sp. FACHB-1407 TaxID=2692847 RepID=UPI0016825E1B|nr:nucleotidyltransferase family protein [Oscillatoria sp. FACHB-1407]MBD2461333.1 nucleotidyltransferase family protein [Oscillatoria sp. FACHB-1407]